MPHYRREAYLRFLSQNKDREQVKILTGLRGAGKTALLRAFMAKLSESGIPENRLVYLDFSDPETAGGFSPEDLARKLIVKLADGTPAYLFFDEIQRFPGFETLVDRLFRVQNLDIYLAGSGLSSKLSPLLSLLPGRCLVREIFPLSFEETLTACTHEPDVSDLLDYTERSTLPGLFELAEPRHRLDTVISSALFYEITENSALRPKLLLKILTLLSKESGNLLSLERIAEETGRAGRPLLLKTIRAALDALENAGLLLTFPLQPVTGLGEFLALGKEYVCRFFFPDPAMMLLYGKGNEYPYRQLMTATACELRRRYASVSCGQTTRGAVDFVTADGPLQTLWQFIPNPRASYAEEKLEILASAPARYRKCVLTLEPRLIPKQTGILLQPLFPWFRGK